MARILGGLTTSHVPGIGRAMAAGKWDDPYWKPFFDAFHPLRAWLDEKQPDAIVIVYNDHGLNFFLDNMPTFAVGLADEYHTADEGWGHDHPRVFRGDAGLSWHIAESLVEDEFDPALCQEMKLDHACTVAGDLLWPGQDSWPAAMVPVEMNIIAHPLPKPRRCYNFGKALGKAIRSYPEDLKVVIVASGGLSHQIGQDGYINDAFDKFCMDKIVNDPEALLGFSNVEWVQKAGSQGLEFMTWLVMRGAIAGDIEVVASKYHAPLSHTGGAVMLMEAQAA
jgi:protocatechuate 4,5-dioxygenase, beta chain